MDYTLNLTNIMNLNATASKLPKRMTQKVTKRMTQKVTKRMTQKVTKCKTQNDTKRLTLNVAEHTTLKGKKPQRIRDSETAHSAKLSLLFETHKEALTGFIRKRIGDSAATEDLLHDLYIKLQSLNIEEIQYPKAYLYRMANNLVIDEQRKQSRFVDQDVDSLNNPVNEITEERSPEAILNQSQRLATVTEALQELPEKTRDVFCLLRLKQLKKQEVASHLGISVNMVEKHVRKAIEYCQNKLKKSEL